MNLPHLGVTRPVLTSMAVLMVVVLGLVSLSRLRIDLLPDVERPTATVRADYEGASPLVVERRVTQILEEITSTVPGVVELRSSSTQGQARVTVTFAWGTDLNAAVQDLRARIEDEIDELPDDITRPSVRTFDVNSFPVVVLGVAGALDPVDLTQLIEDELRDRLARVPGVAQVDPWGGYVREARVAVHPDALQALDLTLDEVADAVRAANVDLPAGRLRSGRFERAVRAPAELADLDALRDVVVATRGGAPIRLAQVADVLDTWEDLTRDVRVQGEPGVRLAVRKAADANTVEVATGILAEVERIHRDFPQLRVVAVQNQGNFIEQSIANVASSVAYGGLFAALVLLYFLRDGRSTLIVATAIPVSLLGTFVLLQVGGFTLNLMTLGGLALGVGMMVDSAIVVLEAIFARREAGDAPAVAAERGAREVAGALLASTVTTLVIFLPVVFFRGVAGLLFSELALVIAISLVVALVTALSVVPMLTARLGGSAPGGGHLNPLERRYERVIRAALERRALTVGLSVVLLAASVGLLPFIGSELLPPSDEGEVRIIGELETGTRPELVDAMTRRIEGVVAAHVPEAAATVATIQGGATGKATGEVQLALGPASARARSNTEVADDLKRRLDGQLAGAVLRTRAPQGSFALNRLLGEDQDGVVIELRGDDLDALDALAVDVARAIADVPGVTDVDDTRADAIPEHRLDVDRAALATYGLTAQDVAALLEHAVAGRQASELRVGGNAWRIFVQLADAKARSIDDLLDLRLRSPSGARVPLRAVVRPADGEGPVEITRRDQRRLVTVTANVLGRPAGDVAADVEARLAELPRPSSVTTRVAGAWEAQQQTFAELRTSLALALALVFMVLAAQYESLKDPVVVMTSVPFAAVGVLVTLWATGTTLNLQSGIGAIMLGGIVVNNAILLVDLASRLRTEGHTPSAAVAVAGRRRLRPILMTTSTTVLGLLPLALGWGEGAEAQAPLARAVVGGLLTSTAISLVLVPVVYTLVHRRPAATPPG